jgi:hypothetical protein
MSGVSYKYYQLIETSKRIDLRLSTLEKLAKAYGIGIVLPENWTGGLDGE